MHSFEYSDNALPRFNPEAERALPVTERFIQFVQAMKETAFAWKVHSTEGSVSLLLPGQSFELLETLLDNDAADPNLTLYELHFNEPNADDARPLGHLWVSDDPEETGVFGVRYENEDDAVLSETVLHDFLDDLEIMVTAGAIVPKTILR